MADDQHPADDLYSSIKGLFNGDNLKQAVRDAWDRMNAPKPAPKPMVKAPDATDAAVQRANKEFLDLDTAARIRAKANGK